MGTFVNHSPPIRMADRRQPGSEPPTYTAAANAALAASAQIHNELLQMISGSLPTVTDLKRWKKLNIPTAASARLRDTSGSTRIGSSSKGIPSVLYSQGEFDQQANSARVFEKLRQYSTLGTQDTDRLMGSAAQMQTMINALAPVQPTSFHGAAWLAIDMSTTLTD